MHPTQSAEYQVYHETTSTKDPSQNVKQSQVKNTKETSIKIYKKPIDHIIFHLITQARYTE